MPDELCGGVQSRSIAMLGEDELQDSVGLPAHLLHNATRSPSGHEFLAAVNRAGGVLPAGTLGGSLRQRSGGARMQLAENTDRNMDFERNRRFTIRCAAQIGQLDCHPLVSASARVVCDHVMLAFTVTLYIQDIRGRQWECVQSAWHAAASHDHDTG